MVAERMLGYKIGKDAKASIGRLQDTVGAARGRCGRESVFWPLGPKRRRPPPLFAPVAQLDRVLASEAKGRGFESRRARHLHFTDLQSR